MMLKWSHATDITNMGQINYYFLQCTIDSFPFPQLATVIEVNSLNYCHLIFTSMTLIKGMEKNQWCTVLSCQEPTTWLGTKGMDVQI